MQILDQYRDQTGQSLGELSRTGPVLVLFIRHLGCVFCREALGDLAQRRADISASGTRIAIVHMSSDDQAKALFTKYQLDDVARFSDPGRKLYQAFGLIRGSVMNVAGPQVWLRGLAAVARHGLGVPQGDVLQMPGAFVIQDGEIIRAFRPQSSADRPDFQSLVSPSRS